LIKIIIAEFIYNLKKKDMQAEIDFKPERVFKKTLPFNDGSGEGIL
jgi:hypothetical protein